ncbi:MAG: hypothetical protein ACYS0K_15710 [Planctomycetota bacterium]|jgi:hypothetical protein
MARTLLFLLAAAAGLASAEGPGAKEIFDKAVATQGAIPAGEIHDITLHFKGQITEGKRVNTIERIYRYRARDRSFYVLTASRASAKVRSERGVLGESGYWERSSRGKIVRLRPGNREDKASVKTIRKNRDEFEGMLRMVLLARIADGNSKLKLATKAPVHLEQDMPYAAADTLGKDRKEHRYHVLDLERKGQPNLRLFIHVGTFTVRLRPVPGGRGHRPEAAGLLLGLRRPARRPEVHAGPQPGPRRAQGGTQHRPRGRGLPARTVEESEK